MEEEEEEEDEVGYYHRVSDPQPFDADPDPGFRK